MGQKVKKNNLMYAGILVTWILCLFYFDPKLYSVLSPSEPLITKVIYIIFIFFLNLFWFYGMYHCFVLLYKIFPQKNIVPDQLSDYPSVAILYTTRNDFQEKAVLSCLNQSYPNFHVYLLDDSTDDAVKSVVDQFHNSHLEQTTIIRRKDRKGFKAGNLNNALRHYATTDKYFAIIDADEVIPSDFIEKLIPYFSIDEKIAFVQASHVQNPKQASKFAQDLGMGIDFHWNVYQPPRNDYGFVIFYGHGAIIQYDVWEKMGGFPEIVSEDLAFSTRIRLSGYRGYFVKEVTCYEDFPETYHQFRKRYEKWVKGACEYLHHEFLPFFLSREITLPEKLDVLSSCFSLFIPALFLIYIFIANAVLPMLLAEKHSLYINIFGHKFKLMSAYFMEPSFEKLWTIDFYVITIIGIFAPIFCYLGKIFSNPRKIIKLLLKSSVPYISLILVSTFGILTYLSTKRAVFLTTGDKSNNASLLIQHGGGRFWDRLNSNHSLVFHLEWILGLILMYFSVKTFNFALLTISSCLILSPLIARFGWEKRILYFLVSLPLLFALFSFGSMGMGFLGIQALSLCFLTLHF
jgi:cellulose synthase/poly-beta-1,6-N-acetylglucosamine synthase-like glycosyltransferase